MLQQFYINLLSLKTLANFMEKQSNVQNLRNFDENKKKKLKRVLKQKILYLLNDS